MKRFLPIALLALTVPLTAHAQQRSITPTGNPSALIAAESAFSRLAREKGQWTAFAMTAGETAEMFVPQRVLAKGWLKGRANPPSPAQWQPSAVWISCDGSAGVTFGAFHGNGEGWFSTVWERQKKGEYKWVLDQSGLLTAPLSGSEFITGKVADCSARPRRNPLVEDAPPVPKPAAKLAAKPLRGAPPPQRPLAGPIPPLAAATGADSKDGRSADGSLAWRSTVLPGGTRLWTVWLWQDGKMTEVLSRDEIARNEG